MAYRIDGDKLWNSLMEMGVVGREEKGVNRLALNDANKEARDLFTRWLGEEGLEVRADLIARANLRRARRDSNPRSQVPQTRIISRLDYEPLPPISTSGK